MQMDVGVGAFIFSSGLVAGPRLNKPSSIYKTIKIVAPALLIGFLRSILTKAVDYQVISN